MHYKRTKLNSFKKIRYPVPKHLYNSEYSDDHRTVSQTVWFELSNKVVERFNETPVWNVIEGAMVEFDNIENGIIIPSELDGMW